MKRLFITLVAVMAFSFAAHSQSKEETIKWLKEKFELYSGSVKVTITTCDITVNGSSFPVTAFSYYSFDVAWQGYDKNGNYLRGSWLEKSTPKEVVDKITKAIKHLAKFCKEEDLF